MSDEQTMPNVVYAYRSDLGSIYYGQKDEWGRATPYLRCDIDPDDAVVVDGRYCVSQKSEGRNLIVRWGKDIDTIATLTAERDARDKQVRELVEALEDMEDQSITVDEEGEDRCTQCGWYAYIHEPACVFALAAQLKEQDDE